MGRRTLLLIASILVAALGTSLVWLYVQGADTRAAQNSNLVSVWFLGQDAEVGADAGGLSLTQKDVSTAAAAGAVTDRATLKGLKLTVRAVTGQILLQTMVGSTDTSRFPKGGAIAISISDPNRVPADLAVGDIVDVYALGSSGGKAVRLVPGVRVRSIGNAVAPASGTAARGTAGSVPATIVGLDVNAQDAETLYNMVAANQQPALYDHGTR